MILLKQSKTGGVTVRLFLYIPVVWAALLIAQSLGGGLPDIIGKLTAAICSIDSRTILNIENYRGNPKMTVLFPLVRGLQIDSQEIFYPGMEIKNPSVRQLRFLIEDCTEQEATALIPVVQSFLGAVRSNNSFEVK